MRHTEHFLCPRRDEVPSHLHWTKDDQWETRKGKDVEQCSFCGSLHPDEFMALVIANEPLGCTTKNYKAYIRDHEKFYYQHLSIEQKKMIVELYNAKKIKFETFDGHEYAWDGLQSPFPYFMSPIPD